MEHGKMSMSDALTMDVSMITDFYLSPSFKDSEKRLDYEFNNIKGLHEKLNTVIQLLARR